MKPESPSPLVEERFVTLRALRWLFSPRKLRVYLWVIVCCVTFLAVVSILFNWRGRQAWNRMHREVRAAGECIDLAGFVPPPVPDDQNFAMTPFLAPLFQFEPGTQIWRDTNAVNRAIEFGKGFPSPPSKTDGWSTGQRTDLTTWASLLGRPGGTNDRQASAHAVLDALKTYDLGLTELREASRRPQARFNICYDAPDPTSILLPHLAVLRVATQMLALRASAHLALGESDPALDDILLALQLADKLKDEPVLISYLVRCGQRVVVAQAVWDGFADRRWSESQLLKLQLELQQRAMWEEVAKATQGERAFGHQIIAVVRRDPAWLPQLGSSDVRNQSPPPPPWPERLFLRSIPRGWFYFEEVEYDRIFRETMLSKAQVASRCLDPATVDKADSLMKAKLAAPSRAFLHQRLLSGMLLPALPGVYRRAARAQVITDQAVLACALERHRLAHGRFPASLKDLVPQWLGAVPADLIKGEPPRYRREADDRFVVYSIGWNGTDDGGVPGLTDRGKADLTRGDWVWRSP